MSVAALRALVRDVNFATHGVAATVTRPAPDDAPITTTVIWLVPVADQAPGGAEMGRMDHRRVLAVRRDEVPTVPRGTRISAAELPDGTVLDWIVDGTDRVEPGHVIVLVVEAPV